MGAQPPPRPVRFPALRSAGAGGRQRHYRRHAAGRWQLDPLRHLRDRADSLRVPAHHAGDAAARHRPDRHPLQLQREVSRRRLCARLRLRHQQAVTAGNREISESSGSFAQIRPGQQHKVTAAQSAEPLQLREHGNGAQLGPVFRRLPLQDPQAHVRQFPHGHERVRHAGVAVLPLPSVLRYRGRHADEDLGPGHAAHLRRTVTRFSGQDLPRAAGPKGLSATLACRD